jgi:hypothetical protein
MKVIVVNPDNKIIIDGVALEFDFALSTDIWAIHWDGYTGHVEYVGLKANTEITDFSDYQYLVDAYNTEAQRLEAEELASQPTQEEATRATRDVLLQATDVWALSDRTMSAEQTAYRQALRDITAQAGFPTDITWPTKPA